MLCDAACSSLPVISDQTASPGAVDQRANLVRSLNWSSSKSHVDRGVYETLELRLARHPSESPEYLVTRLLAYCLEYTEGIAFSKGLSDPDEPAIVVRDLTGALRAWIKESGS
jgi:uncharacterized protein YaeQ